MALEVLRDLDLICNPGVVLPEDFLVPMNGVEHLTGGHLAQRTRLYGVMVREIKETNPAGLVRDNEHICIGITYQALLETVDKLLNGARIHGISDGSTEVLETIIDERELVTTAP